MKNQNVSCNGLFMIRLEGFRLFQFRTEGVFVTYRVLSEQIEVRRNSGIM